jgi:hypothetical protein
MDDKLELKEDRPMWLLNDIKADFQKLYDHYRWVSARIEHLEEENKRLKSDAYKDEELAKMKSEYDRMKEDYFRGFPISEEEHKKINEWIDEQMKKHPGIGGAIGGRFTYEFLPTSIGTAGTIIDSFTGDKFNFQELG